MNIIEQIFQWIKSLLEKKEKPVEELEFKSTETKWVNNKIAYEGFLRATKVYRCKHHLECRILTVKESKEHWQPKKTMPTHWIKFFYVTSQGTHIYLVDKHFSFIPEVFAAGGAYVPNDLAKKVVDNMAKRIILISRTPMFTFGEQSPFPPIPSRDLFLKDKENRSSQFWETIILGEYQFYLEQNPNFKKNN